MVSQEVLFQDEITGTENERHNTTLCKDPERLGPSLTGGSQWTKDLYQLLSRLAHEKLCSVG